VRSPCRPRVAGPKAPHVTKPISEAEAALRERLDDTFRLLARGVVDRRSAFHTPTVCTLSPDGAPSARTVILRGFDPKARFLTLHTDRRSAKAEHLAHDARAEAHTYDGRRRVQVRLSCRSSVHRADAVAWKAWSAIRPESRSAFAVSLSPGSPISTRYPAGTGETDGYENFLLVRLNILRLERLDLLPAAHERALFVFHSDGVEATWLAP